MFAVFEHAVGLFTLVWRESSSRENLTSLEKQLALLEAAKVSYLLSLSYLDNSVFVFFFKVILVKRNLMCD